MTPPRHTAARERAAERVVGAYIAALDRPPFVRRKHILAWADTAGFAEEYRDLVSDLYALLGMNRIRRDTLILRAIEGYTSPDGRGGYVRHSFSRASTLYTYDPEKYAAAPEESLAGAPATGAPGMVEEEA